MCLVTLQTHPTVNPGAGDILHLVKNKKVTPKPGILCYNDNTVTFMDGTTEEVDAVICATGMGKPDCPALGRQTARVDGTQGCSCLTCHAAGSKHKTNFASNL